jgi:hypothetical protein
MKFTIGIIAFIAAYVLYRIKPKQAENTIINNENDPSIQLNGTWTDVDEDWRDLEYFEYLIEGDAV